MSEDLIRRSDAIKATLTSDVDDVRLEDVIAVTDAVADAIEAIPTIEPKQGEWIPHKQDNGKTILWKCSECGRVIYSETETDRLEFNKWCSRCGADMRGEK